jgi:hypothetical protein
MQVAANNGHSLFLHAALPTRASQITQHRHVALLTENERAGGRSEGWTGHAAKAESASTWQKRGGTRTIEAEARGTRTIEMLRC